MSKIHYLLIFLIITLLSAVGWMLMESGEGDKEIKVAKKQEDLVIQDNRVNTAKRNQKAYVQGAIELPDLSYDFERCLKKGYNPKQIKILERAQNAFSDKSFDEGKFSWNKVEFSDEFGELTQLILGHNSEGEMILETLKKNDEGKFEVSETSKEASLEILEARMEGITVLKNEYSHTVRKNDLEMEIILSNGVMKYLKSKTPKKTVVCKP